MPDKNLKKFIKAARKKGFSDLDLKKALVGKGWNIQKIEEAFLSLQPKLKYKNQICLFLSNDIIDILDKRARKNLFTLGEQIEDILRRSCIKKKTATSEKLDDLLLTCFSRSQKGRKKK